MAKIVVTGGAGFIGSHIVDKLSEGHEVHVIDDLSSGSTDNIPSSVKLHQLDIRSPEAASFIGEFQPNILVHAAAQISVRISMEQPALDTDVNVTGLVNLLHPLCRTPGAQCIFLSSGGACYGEQQVYPAPESHPIGTESIYGLSKRVGEMYLEFCSRIWGLSYTSLRLSNVYGPRQNPHGEAGVIAIYCERLLAGRDIVVNGTGEQTRDFVFVGDVAKAVELSVEKRTVGEFNIGTAKETSVLYLAKELQKRINPEAKINFGPGRAGEQLRSVIDNSLVAKTLGWRPTINLQDGLEQTLEWYRSKNPR